MVTTIQRQSIYYCHRPKGWNYWKSELSSTHFSGIIMTQPQFSELPGARERQLQRRSHNPLFTDELQVVTQSQVDSAHQQDLEEEKQFSISLLALLNDVSSFSGKEETDKILQVKEQADRLYEQCIGLAGEHERERQGLLKLNDAIMTAIRAAAGEDPLALSELEKEQQARTIHLSLLECPLIADILRADAVIEEDQLTPTILSADEEAIEMALSLFSLEQRQALVEEASQIKSALEQSGKLDKQLEKKFRMMATWVS
jgi:hypothetical protein